MNAFPIREFTLHGESGVAVKDKDFVNWLRGHSPSELGSRIVGYSWIVDDQRQEHVVDVNGMAWHVLPDASGFICFETDWRPDNCVLLDAYGKERLRLTVPWQLTKPQNPESAKSPTSFANISEPHTHPVTGLHGEFGVTAWVEHAGKYYFELNYQTGEFLWGREIRD